MQDDDVMPLDGTFLGGVPVEPKEQRLARQKERADTLQAKTELEKVIAHFQERIDFRNSLDSINISAITTPELHLRACVTNDLLKLALEEEKRLLEELLELYGR